MVGPTARRPQSPARRRIAPPWLAGVAVLVALAACGPNTGGSPGASGMPSASSDPSGPGAPSAPASAAPESAAPAPSEPAGGIGVDQWFEVVAVSLNVRMEPSTTAESFGRLPEGQQGLIVGGPVEAEGYAWYAAVGPGLPIPAGCIPEADPEVLTCPAWGVGWVAAASAAGDPFIAPTQVQCPERPTTVTEFNAIGWNLRAWCFGQDILTIRAFVSPDPPDHGCNLTYTVTPDWLSPCDLVFLQSSDTEPMGGFEISANLYPSVGECDFGGREPAECPINQFVGQFVDVTGVHDHPDAAGCQVAEVRPGTEAPHPAAVTWNCRVAFVIIGLRPAP